MISFKLKNTQDSVMQRLPLAHNYPVVVVKDILRGARFAVKTGGKILLAQENPFLGHKAGDVLRKNQSPAGLIIDKIARVTEEAFTDPFVARKFPPADFFGPRRFPEGNWEISEAAHVLYGALSYTLKKAGIKDALLSETVCHECLRRFSLTQGVKHDWKNEQKAAYLFKLILEHKTIGRPLDLIFPSDSSCQDAVAAAAFAAVLWMFVPREDNMDDEAEILLFCCDIAADSVTDIAASGLDERSGAALFKYFLNVV